MIAPSVGAKPEHAYWIAAARETWHIWALFLAYGAHYGLSEPAERALIKDLAPAQQRELAQEIRDTKAHDQARRRQRVRQDRAPLPLEPTPYMVRQLKGAHPRYEGPFVGVPCPKHTPNCRRVWRQRPPS